MFNAKNYDRYHDELEQKFLYYDESVNRMSSKIKDLEQYRHIPGMKLEIDKLIEIRKVEQEARKIAQRDLWHLEALRMVFGDEGENGQN